MAGFIKKLTGGGNNNNDDIFDRDEEYEVGIKYDFEEEDAVGSELTLAVDAYEDEEYIYIKTFIPAVNPKELDIDVSRDTVTISGERLTGEDLSTDAYFQRELSWGKFQKKILLTKEVDIESIKANVSNGVLTLKLPKMDKDRKMKVQIS